MTRFRLPHALLMVLMAVAVAAPAAALPPFVSIDGATPVASETVGDAELDAITGKYLGSNMLVGVRIDLVSTLSTAQGGQASAAGSLYVRRIAGGFEVQIDSRASAVAAPLDPLAPDVAPASGNLAIGASGLSVQGIGQVTQIAGDGNRMSNLAVIRFVDGLATPVGFNGEHGQQTGAGGMTAQVTFIGGGVRIGLAAPGAIVGQHALTDGAGGVMQIGQIAGNGMVANNTMSLQMLATAMPTLSMQQLGIQQALAAISGLRR